MEAIGNASGAAGSSLFTILVTAVLTLVGVVAIYYFYNFMYKTPIEKPVVVVGKEVQATTPPTNLPTIPAPFEGGDYTVSVWVYVNSFNINRNRRKHILEIGGTNFATLLVGLGAFKNTLVVRTHSRDSELAFMAADSYGGASSAPATTPPSSESCAPTSTDTPNAQTGRSDGSLTKTDLDALFAPLALDDSLLEVNPLCDLPEIDMQRWTLVTVVLSGRVIDVYLNGKLSRSCVSRSYYKVDPTGVKIKVLDRGGFDCIIVRSGGGLRAVAVG